MSKNSFTKNFNNCVAGFPIASVAAHMVLHEGLLKDIGKVGALAGLGYLGYNYGDQVGNLVNQAGSAMGFGDHNVVGDTLGNWHNTAKNWVQDSFPGKLAGLGGDDALKRQAETEAIEKYKTDAAAAKQQRINDAFKNISDPQQREAVLKQIEIDHNNAAKRAGEYAVLKKQGELDSERSGGRTNAGALHAAESQYNKNSQIQLPDASNAVNAGANAGGAAGQAFKPVDQQGTSGGIVKTTGHQGSGQPPVQESQPERPQAQQPVQGTPAPQPAPQQQPAPKNDVKLNIDPNKYNQYAQAIPAGAEFGLTPTTNSNSIPQQNQQSVIQTGVNAVNQGVSAQRQADADREYQQADQQHQQGMIQTSAAGAADQIRDSVGNVRTPGMQLNANPQATQRLTGNQPSMAAGTNANLGNVQNPVFKYKNHQDLNTVNFDTQHDLKKTTLGSSFTPNQNQSNPSPFGPKQQNQSQNPQGMKINPQRSETLNQGRK